MNSLAALEKDALTMDQIKILVGPQNSSRCKFLPWDELARFETAEQLLNLGAVVVLLSIETRDAPAVGHFILLLDHGSHIEHFDSYGLTMQEELQITKEQHLTRIFDRYRKPVINNTAKLQTLKQDVNTCGRWVAARLLLRKMELDKFLQLVKQFGSNTDQTVSCMTMLLNYKQ